MIHWDPNPDIFIIPYLNWPIKWYGLLFALGFAFGFPIFKGIIYRYLLQRPKAANLNYPLDREKACKGIPTEIVRSFEQTVAKAHCESPDESVALLCWEAKFGNALVSLKEKAAWITDQITLYMIIATVVGARVGHFLFYEDPAEYLRNPLEFFKLREGGLASHGAVIGIIIALTLFSDRAKKVDSGLSTLRLLDFICVPTALAGALIRVGNFFNQEILGTLTNMPWGVVFGHPMDGSLSIARHPVQIYEALFYLATFCLLYRNTFYPSFLLAKGRLIGLFFIMVFGFRFGVEFFKLEQSRLFWIEYFPLTMGQWLSLPLIVAGFFLFFRREMTEKVEEVVPKCVEPLKGTGSLMLSKFAQGVVALLGVLFSPKYAQWLQAGALFCLKYINRVVKVFLKGFIFFFNHLFKFTLTCISLVIAGCFRPLKSLGLSLYSLIFRRN